MSFVFEIRPTITSIYYFDIYKLGYWSNAQVIASTNDFIAKYRAVETGNSKT